MQENWSRNKAEESLNGLPSPLKPLIIEEDLRKKIREDKGKRFYSGPMLLGYSLESRPLYLYRLGRGKREKMIVGGIHGGYEPASAVVVMLMLDYLLKNPDLIEEDSSLFILPLLNPDGYCQGHSVRFGRTNARFVDLNRNWGSLWKPVAYHGTTPISAGRIPFSEPETRALRKFILKHNLESIVLYHGGWNCIICTSDDQKSEAYQLAKYLSEKSNYNFVMSGSMGGPLITGSASDWLLDQGISPVVIEQKNHHSVEWEKNRLLLEAYLEWQHRQQE